MPDNVCIDCGKPTAGGLRCKSCHGQLLARRALDDTAESDAMVLQTVSEGVSGARLAARLGISRVRASRRIKSAKAREEKRRA